MKSIYIFGSCSSHHSCSYIQLIVIDTKVIAVFFIATEAEPIWRPRRVLGDCEGVWPAPRVKFFWGTAWEDNQGLITWICNSYSMIYTHTTSIYTCTRPTSYMCNHMHIYTCTTSEQSHVRAKQMEQMVGITAWVSFPWGWWWADFPVRGHVPGHRCHWEKAECGEATDPRW